MSDQSPLNPGAYWVRPGKVMAGPYPGSWHEEKALKQVERLLDAGVDLFIDLTEPRELDPYEPYLAGRARHIRKPIRDMTIPTEEHMRDILDTIDMVLLQGRTVYVHCWGGIGRTGTVIGCWLVRHGMPGVDALKEIVRLRDGETDSPQTFEQFDMVRNWREDGAG